MSDARAFFDAIAGRYDRVYAIDPRLSRERMTRVLAELPKRARVLDLGVGTGRELTALQDAGHDVTGVDISKAMIAIAMRRARPIRIREHDFWSSIPFDDASFDAVIALHGAIAHPPDAAALPRFFSEIACVLVPGGVFVAEVPSHAWLESLGSEEHVDDEGRVVRRIADDRCAYEDRVTGARIEAFIPDDARWPSIVGPGFDVAVEAIGPHERLVVARKRS